MLLWLLYWAVRRLLRILAPGSSDELSQEIEILVLRLQLHVQSSLDCTNGSATPPTVVLLASC